MSEVQIPALEESARAEEGAGHILPPAIPREEQQGARLHDQALETGAFSRVPSTAAAALLEVAGLEHTRELLLVMAGDMAVAVMEGSIG